MTEHLFLCGLSETQRSAYKGGRQLDLHGPKPNVRLRLDGIRRNLLKVETALLADLIELAAYVFAADCSVARGGITFRNFGDKWRRQFHLVVAVRQPDRWSDPQLLHALRDALEFLSADTWTFTFEKLTDSPPIQSYLSFLETDADESGGTSIVLFSGGLDSFAGAIHELTNSDRHVVLMSHRLVGMTNSRQDELASVINERFQGRVSHVPLSAGLTNKAKAREHTQRTRSFLLAAMAMVAAVMEDSDRIRFYENGIMSVNLPISTQVVGARASRSTHPRSLMLLEKIGKLVAIPDVRIDNPFIWMTKAEVVAELLTQPESQAVSRTLSCSQTRNLKLAHPHCGRCAQCLQRRLSTLGANAGELDPQVDYAVDLLIGPRLTGQDRAMAVDVIRSAMEFRRLSKRDFATHYAGELAWLMTGFPGELHESVAWKCFALFKRHWDTVDTIFVRARESYAEAPFDKTLPDSCLLRMVPHSTTPPSAVPWSDVAPAAPSDEGMAEAKVHQTPAILLAVDADHMQVIVDGLAPICGATNFRLLSVLVTMHVEDRDQGLLPDHYRTLSSKALADAIGGTSDTTSRQVIQRIRKRIHSEWVESFGVNLGLNAVIENVSRKGYRLNPKVRVISAAELHSQ